MPAKLTFNIVEKSKTPEHSMEMVTSNKKNRKNKIIKMTTKASVSKPADKITEDSKNLNIVDKASLDEKRRLLLQNWYKKTQMRRIMHIVTSRLLHRWHMFFGCTVMILSALTGGAGMSLTNKDEEIVSYSMSGASMVVAALSAIQHFCKFESRSTEHQHIAEDYDKLSRVIQTKMQEPVVPEILENITVEFNGIVDKAPLVPENIAKKYCDLVVDDVDGDLSTELCDV